MTYKKEYSEGLTKRTCCICGNYWPHTGAHPLCIEEQAQLEFAKNNNKAAQVSSGT